MNLSGLASMLNTAAGLTLAEKGLVSAKVVITGFVVVFVVLILLIFIIKLYSAIVMKTQQGGKSKKKLEKIDEPAKTASVKETQQSVVASAVVNGVSEEVVAVISAAVATMYGSPEKARIKSIKKSDGGRSAWANAGLLDNTRPF